MPEQISKSINRRRNANIIMLFLAIILLYAGLQPHESAEKAIGSIIGWLMLPYPIIIFINRKSKNKKSIIHFIAAIIILVLSIFYVSRSYYNQHKYQQAIQNANSAVEYSKIYLNHLYANSFGRYEKTTKDIEQINLVFDQIKIAQQSNNEEILVLEQKMTEIKNYTLNDINIFFDQDAISRTKHGLDDWDNFMDKLLELHAKNDQIAQDCINSNYLSLSPSLKLVMSNILNKSNHLLTHLLKKCCDIQKKIIVESSKIIAIATRNLTKAKITDSGNL